MKPATMPRFLIGDRVQLRPGSADEWIDPKLQRAARSNRPGTVADVIGTALPISQRSYAVVFDVTPRTKPLREVIHVKDLEMLAEVVELN